MTDKYNNCILFMIVIFYYIKCTFDKLNVLLINIVRRKSK